MEVSNQTILKLEKAVVAATKRKVREARRLGAEGRALTEQQEAFCDVFVKTGGDFKRAYEAAGYSTAGKYWEIEASKMRSNPKIWRRIEELRQGLMGDSDITEQWILSTAKKFVEKSFLLGDIRSGNASLELMAKILGCLKGDGQAAKAGLMAQFNFNLGGNNSKDIARLAKAAGVRVIDVIPQETDERERVSEKEAGEIHSNGTLLPVLQETSPPKLETLSTLQDDSGNSNAEISENQEGQGGAKNQVEKIQPEFEGTREIKEIPKV